MDEDGGEDPDDWVVFTITEPAGRWVDAREYAGTLLEGIQQGTQWPVGVDPLNIAPVTVSRDFRSKDNMAKLRYACGMNNISGKNSQK